MLTAISMVVPPQTPHLFLTNNYLDIPPNFGQALTIAIRHDRDCYTSSLSTVASSYITLRSNIGPKELIKLIIYPFKTLQYCTLPRMLSACLRMCSASTERVRQGEVGCSAVHMAAPRLDCKRAMFSIRWANSHPGCMKGLRKHYSHFLGVLFWQRRLVWPWMGVCQLRMLTTLSTLVYGTVQNSCISDCSMF